MSKQTIAVQILENTMEEIDGYISEAKEDIATGKEMEQLYKCNIANWNKDKEILQEALYVLTGEST